MPIQFAIHPSSNLVTCKIEHIPSPDEGESSSTFSWPTPNSSADSICWRTAGDDGVTSTPRSPVHSRKRSAAAPMNSAHVVGRSSR